MTIEKRFVLDGTGDYLTTPDAAGFSALGDFSIVARVNATDWTPTASGAIASQYGAGGARSFRFVLVGASAGTLRLVQSTGGTTVVTATSTSAPSFTDGTTYWVMVTRASSSGDVKFYTAADNGSNTPPSSGSFTQLGSTVTGGPTGNLFNSASSLYVGESDSGAGFYWTGSIYRVTIYSGIYGSGSESRVADMLADDYSSGTTFTASTTGETWTLNGDAHTDAAVSDGDTGSGADAGETITVTVSDGDTGSGVDAGESVAGALSDGDTGSGADGGESIAGTLTDDDPGSGADGGESVAGTVTDGDTSSGVDAGESIAIRVDVTDGDTGSGADAGETITVTISDGDTGSGADAGEAIAVTITDGDTGTGVDAGSVYAPPVPPPPPGLRGLSSADLLDLRVSQRIESVVWVILNYDLTYAFTATSVDMDDPPTVHFDATAETNRTLSGLRFGVEDAARINPLTHLIQPRWVLDDGSTWPLGVFHFANTPLDVYSWGNEFTPDCYDRSVVLNQPRAGTFTVPVGMLFTQAIRIVLDEVAMTSWAAIDGSGIAATVPMTFAAGTTRKRILAALCEALAFFPPYFDNDGFLRLRAVPNPISDAAPDVIYEADQWSRIVMDSVHASSNIADAPNVYRVVGSPAAGGEVVGEFRVPDSAPHSVARRGFEVVRQEQNQSVVDQQGANAAAQALYANDTSTHVTVDFETAPDPRADGNQIVRFLGTNYREMQWGLTCTPGGRMVHSAQEVWVP